VAVWKRPVSEQAARDLCAGAGNNQRTFSQRRFLGREKAAGVLPLMRDSAAAAQTQHFVNSASHKWINVISLFYLFKQRLHFGQRAPCSCVRAVRACTERVGSISADHSCRNVSIKERNGKKGMRTKQT